MPKLICENIKSQLVEKYKTGQYTFAQLGREFSLDKSTVNYILKTRGFKVNKTRSELSRLYNLNENYFDNIDTEAKAYFLGLLYADGFNSKEGNYFSIALKEEDSYILEIFNKELGSNRPLRFINLNDKKREWSNCYELGACSKYLSKKLTELGCVYKKSLVLKFPTEQQVPSYLLHHFVRGYFDGDGCISHNSNKNPRASITSTRNFCIELQEVLLKEINTLKSKIIGTANKDNLITNSLLIFGKYNCLDFSDWIYKDASIFLKRKRYRFLSIYPRRNRNVK